MPKTMLIAGVKMLADGDRICASVAAGKPFEPESLAAWHVLCRRLNAIVLDIGAYTGLFSIVARQLGAHVIAFEPMPENRKRFMQNARLNDVSPLCNEEIVSDACGNATLHYNPIPFTSGASLVRRKGPSWTTRSVTVDSLDLKKLTAMKIDVERGEPMVLAGAQATLQRLKPVLLVEVLDDEREAAVRAALPDYRVARVLDVRNWLMVPC